MISLAKTTPGTTVTHRADGTTERQPLNGYTLVIGVQRFTRLATLADVSARYEQFRGDKGASQCPDGKVLDGGGTHIGNVSYNGRIWPPEPWTVDSVPIYDNRAPEPAPRFVKLHEQFPDYPLADLPPIPLHWRDESWHNDASPCFIIGDPGALLVYVDYAESERREEPEAVRFQVHQLDSEGQFPFTDTLLYCSDDWDEVLAFVADNQPQAFSICHGNAARGDIRSTAGNIAELIERFGKGNYSTEADSEGEPVTADILRAAFADGRETEAEIFDEDGERVSIHTTGER